MGWCATTAFSLLDANGNQVVDYGSELIFARDGLTDLQGLAADHDSNRDGVLTAADDNFALFGVWQDANGNGVTDAGEYRSLSDAGIVSIGLVSDGIGYSAANGDVAVAGQSTYAKADGTTGIVADAAFATNAAQATSSRASEPASHQQCDILDCCCLARRVAADASPAFADWGEMRGSELVQFEYRPFASKFEPFDMAAVQREFSPTSFAPQYESVQRIGAVNNSLRAVDEADFASRLTDAPAWQMADLLGDSLMPSHSASNSMSMAAFAGDAVMHNMLDLAAFGPPTGANDNPAIPMAAEDAIRGAMPEMMMDRLVDSFAGDIGRSGNEMVAKQSGGDALFGVLDQMVEAFHLSPINSHGIPGSQQYDMSTINN